MARRVPPGDSFNVDYGISSTIIGTGLSVIATTQCAYHGMSVIALASTATIIVYDNKSATTGNAMDNFTLVATSTVRDRNIPIVARKGITVSLVGSGATATVFYGPKG